MTTAEPDTLGNIAEVRSKNAGPFWLTIDIFLADHDTYTRVLTSAATAPETYAGIYRVDPRHVRVFALESLNAIKVSFPRPNDQGSPADRDMHGGQQYVPLLAIAIPPRPSAANTPGGRDVTVGFPVS